MGPSDSDVEFLRAQDAVRRGWLRREQVSEALRDGAAGDDLLGECRRRGWIDAAQVRRLRDATIVRRPSPPDDDDPIGPDSVIAGRYRVERVLQGGFGRVYLCRTKEGETAALKTLLRKHLETAELRERFVQEARRWIALGRHPNLVTAFGVEEHLRMPFLVMECVEGGKTLGDRIDAGLAWREGAALGLQVARGLAHAGRASGLVHRDLKPANVLVDAGGTAKVSDFGLALLRGERDPDCCGTPTYMPPEQWSSPDRVDVRSDVYAFGVMLFETLTGRLPFLERTLPTLEEAHRAKAPPDPRSLAPQLPEPLAAFVLRCLEKKQGRRPADFVAVESELARWAEAERGTATILDPADEAVNRSRSELSLGRPKEALHFAEEALRRSADHLGGLVAKALALADLLRLDEAIGLLRRAASLHPRSALPFVNLAHLERLAGRLPEALDALRRALPLAAPKELEGCFPVLIDAGLLDDALALSDRILAEDLDSLSAWTHRAIVLRRKGDLPGALESADRALRLNPRYAKGWSNRASILVQSGRFDEAIESAQRAIEIDPALAGAYAAMAAALRALGRNAEAKTCLKDGLRKLPDDPLLKRSLGSE